MHGISITKGFSFCKAGWGIENGNSRLSRSDVINFIL